MYCNNMKLIFAEGIKIQTQLIIFSMELRHTLLTYLYHIIIITCPISLDLRKCVFIILI